MSTSYYKVKNGQKFDAELLATAKRLQAGRRDGRISEADAPALAAEVNDMNVKTRVEKRTVNSLRQTDNFTPAGRKAFNDAIRNTPEGNE
jgi:hypothetical protein